MRKVASFICAMFVALNVGVFDCSGAYDVLIESGLIHDGSGGEPYVADVGIDADRIVAIGKLKADADLVIDAQGLAVAPGFINMLSWANESLIQDGRSQSDIRQGVTLEIMGEGTSMGPLNEAMKRDMREGQGDVKFNVEWTTLGEYLEYLERRGVSTNVASFVGAATVRIHALGYEDRTPTSGQLMRELVAQAMEQGAVGVSSALIYAPGVYAETDELIALAEVVGRYGGMYISHLRSEGNNVLAALDELITIARKANVAAEFYHFKAAGKPNWGKLDAMIAKVEAARAEGLKITADMYNYTAGATGLDAAMPPWVQDGSRRRDAPLGTGRRAPGLGSPAQRPASQTAAGQGDDHAHRPVGEPVSSGRFAREGPPGGVQESATQASYGQDARRGRRAEGQVTGGDRDGPGHRGRQPGRHGVLPDVGGKCEKADQTALGQLLFGRRFAGAGGSLPQGKSASARVRQLRPAARKVCSRREGHHAGRGGQAVDVAAG